MNINKYVSEDDIKIDDQEKDDMSEDDEYEEDGINPSQSEESDSSTTSVVMMNCGMCDSRCRSLIDLRNHKKMIHCRCSFCYSTFETKEKLENHKIYWY